MRRNTISILVGAQSIVIGLWLFIHHGNHDSRNKIRGFEHMEFVESWLFYAIVIFVGVLLIAAVVRKKEKIQMWSLILMNTIWSAYTVILLINEFSGVPNMSWALFLGYNAAIYLAARYEVTG